MACVVETVSKTSSDRKKSQRFNGVNSQIISESLRGVEYFMSCQVQQQMFSYPGATNAAAAYLAARGGAVPGFPGVGVAVPKKTQKKAPKVPPLQGGNRQCSEVTVFKHFRMACLDWELEGLKIKRCQPA